MDNTKNKLICVYSLLGLSIFSCLLRMDYNIIITFGLLLLYKNYFYLDKKLYVKIIIHTLIVSFIFDILWMIIMIPNWSSDYKTEEWKSYSYLRVIILIFAFIEFASKAAICYFEYNSYNIDNPDDPNYLYDMNYSNHVIKKKLKSKVELDDQPTSKRKISENEDTPRIDQNL